MKARTARYTDTGEIEIVDQEVGEPGSGELQVEGAYCGICSWDIATCRLGRHMKVPATPGHEGVGYVHKVGAGVDGFEVGDRVAVGGFQTLMNHPAAGVAKIPDTDIPDELWVVEPASCVVTGLDTCPLRLGDRVALIGCGFMGLMYLQVLVRSAADQVIGIDVEPSRLELARSLGADEVYDLSACDLEELAPELKARGVDVAVDASGSQGGLDLAAQILRRGGHINLFGWIKGETATFDPTAWHIGGFTIVNSSPAAKLRDTFPAAIGLIEKGMIDTRPLVTHVVDLEEYPALMKDVLRGGSSYIKGVIRLK